MLSGEAILRSSGIRLRMVTAIDGKLAVQPVANSGVISWYAADIPEPSP